MEIWATHYIVMTMHCGDTYHVNLTTVVLLDTPCSDR